MRASTWYTLRKSAVRSRISSKPSYLEKPRAILRFARMTGFTWPLEGCVYSLLRGTGLTDVNLRGEGAYFGGLAKLIRKPDPNLATSSYRFQGLMHMCVARAHRPSQATQWWASSRGTCREERGTFFPAIISLRVLRSTFTRTSRLASIVRTEIDVNRPSCCRGTQRFSEEQVSPPFAL